jgi:hypothetical protein
VSSGDELDSLALDDEDEDLQDPEAGGQPGEEGKPKGKFSEIAVSYL